MRKTARPYLTFTQLEAAISAAYRRGETRVAEDLEFERNSRRDAARDRWAEEASDKKARAADRRKYGGFYS